MIEIKNIVKEFDNSKIFNDLSLHIDKGEFVIFSGPSGCGKTTLLNMIGGLEHANKGEILVNGIDVFNKKNQLKYYREVVCFLFQNFALVDNKTVYENLACVKKRSRTDMSFDEALEKVGLLDKKMKGYIGFLEENNSVWLLQGLW